MSELDVAAFRGVLSRWASGVSVVTTNDDGMLYGLTVSSFTSLSLSPPLVLVCVANANRFLEMVEASRSFAVSLLASEQATASSYFATPGRLPTPDFTAIEGEWTPSGQPVVAGALAWLVCAKAELLQRGDHTIVVGEVVETHLDPEKTPLVYWNRGYRLLNTAG